MAACVWVLIKPGARIALGWSMSIRREILRVDFPARSDVDNVIAQNRDRAIFDYTALRVLGDHVAGGPDEVDGTAGWLLRRKRGATE